MNGQKKPICSISLMLHATTIERIQQLLEAVSIEVDIAYIILIYIRM